MKKAIRYLLIGIATCLSLWILVLVALVGPATAVLVLYSMLVIEPTMTKHGREHPETARVCAHGAKIMHVLEPLASDATFIAYWKQNRAELEKTAERIQFDSGPWVRPRSYGETAEVGNLPTRVARARRAFDWRPRPYEVNDLSAHERICVTSDAPDESCKDVLLAGIEFELNEGFARSRVNTACAGKFKFFKTLLFFPHGELPRIAGKTVIGPTDIRFDKPRWKLNLQESLDTVQRIPLNDSNSDLENPFSLVRKLSDRWFIRVNIL
jgi:hypothetical protein